MLLCKFSERTLFILMWTLFVVFYINIFTMPVRCALGCERRGVHRFPVRFPEQFKAWVHLMGGKLERPEDYLAYQNKRICSIHFLEKDYNRNNRLNALAVPSQHLPAWCSLPEAVDSSTTSTIYNMESNLEQGELPHTSGTTTTTTCAVGPDTEKAWSPIPQMERISAWTMANTPSIMEKGDLLQLSEPAITTACSTELDFKRVNVGQSSIENTKTIPIYTRASSNTSNVVPVSSVLDTTISKEICRSSLDYIELEHNYCSKAKMTKKCNKHFLIPSLQIPRVKQLMRQIKNLKQEISRLRKRGLSYKARLANAIKISDDFAFKQVTRQMSEPAKLFTYMNFREAGKKPKGRRFTIDEKVLALSIFKRSPKCYTLLAKYFTLPSKKSLKGLLSLVVFKPGINKIIFDKLKRTVKGMNLEDTLCTLIFDEMAITPQLHYDVAKDVLKGFNISQGKCEISDHVLVFMIKGIKSSFKQPIAYYFTNNLKKEQLKTYLIEVINEINLTGLQIVCTVCDQSTVNVSTINSLVADTKANVLRRGMEWREEHFKVGHKKIIPVYDCPHLLKGLRNNLLSKDLIYFHDDTKKIIKSSYFEMLYAADKTKGELRCVQKLTEEHVNRDKIKKMRVKPAAQVFSHSVAVATDHFCARGDLPDECRDLIPFVILVDNLFDSLNSSTFHIPNGKIYKAGLKKNSPHHELWLKAIKILKSAKYIAKKITEGKIRFIEMTVPSLTNFIKTIEAVQCVWKILSEKYSIDCLFTRNLNQDPLENFFGNIRSYGYRNVAPNCANFEGAFKALLLNNFNSPHSVQANCEEDCNDALQDLKFFLTEKSNIPKEIQESDFVININEHILTSFNDEVVDEDKGQRNYVCGWVVTKCLKNISKNCMQCRKDLIDINGDNSTSHAFIQSKEYNNKKRWLCYPSKDALSTFQIIQKATCGFLKRDVPKVGVKSKIKIICDTIITTYPFKCKKHNLKYYFVNTSLNLLICSWCRSINRILSGKITYNCNGEDELKVAAQTYYNKHKNIKFK